MGQKKVEQKKRAAPAMWERARDELYSHILSCGVLEAGSDHQREWFDDTLEYLSERYTQLREGDLRYLREAGERFCRPVIGRDEKVAATS